MRAVARQRGRLQLKRSIFEFFNSGSGSWLSMAIIDLHFWLWKRRHGPARFSEYYARSIAAELRSGGTHKTLGGKRFLSGSLVSGPDEIDPMVHRKRGISYFRAAIRNGLRPEHRCIDFGCGSLRVGQHLIAYLEPDNYRGLDIVSDFYEAGKILMPPMLLEQKRPQFRLIGPDIADLARSCEADFIVSFAVLKHVPPCELDYFIGSIAALMAPSSKAVISFNQSHRTVRTGAKIWGFCEDDIAANVSKLGASYKMRVGPFKDESVAGALPRTSLLVIERQDVTGIASTGAIG